MRISLTLSLGMALAASALCARAADDPPQLADALTAIVGDTPITTQQVERLVDLDDQALAQQFANRPNLYYKERARLRESGSEILIEREVVLQEFKKNIKVPESIIEEYVQDEIKRMSHGDNIELTKKLEAEGITREEFKKQVREKFIVSAMRDKFIPEAIISPKKVEDFYLAHRNDFKVEDQVRLRMIILGKAATGDAAQAEQTHKRALELVSQLKGGAKFEELARVYSEGSSAKDGGDTGWEDVSVVNPLLVTELNKLKPGQFSDVIEASDGYYLILLEDRHPAHFKPLNEVRQQIEQALNGMERERLGKKWMDRLKDKTFVARLGG